MATPSCMKDVWDITYQERLVEIHAHETQVFGFTGDPEDCPQCITNCPKETIAERFPDDGRWDIK